jgi:hypothetical protein
MTHKHVCKCTSECVRAAINVHVLSVHFYVKTSPVAHVQIRNMPMCAIYALYQQHMGFMRGGITEHTCTLFKAGHLCTDTRTTATATRRVPPSHERGHWARRQWVAVSILWRYVSSTGACVTSLMVPIFRYVHYSLPCSWQPSVNKCDSCIPIWMVCLCFVLQSRFCHRSHWAKSDLSHHRTNYFIRLHDNNNTFGVAVYPHSAVHWRFHQAWKARVARHGCHGT